MGNCFTHESGRIRSRSESESRAPPSPRAESPPLDENTTPVKRQPLLPPSAQASRTPSCVADKNKVKKKVRFADDAVCGEVKIKKEVEVTSMRVKIVVRKKDVALLLDVLGAGDDQSAMDGILSN